MRVGKEEKKEVEKWRSRIQVAKKHRDGEGRKTAWSNMKKYYRNFYDEKTLSVNLIFSYGRQLIPFLYFKNPIVECTALWSGWEKKAKILEAVDNMLIRKMRVKEQLKLIIQDAYLYDYGIRKVGYDSEFGYDPDGSLWMDLFKELGIPTTKEEAKEYNTYITSEFPFFLRVPPSRFYVDPDTDGPSLDSARWVIEEFYRPLEDLLEDDRYSIPKDIKASHMIEGTDSGAIISPVKEEQIEPTGKPRDFERCRIYEIWDKRDRKVRWTIDNHNGFIREQDDVWNLTNFFPYERLCFNGVSDEHYSTSDAMYIERQQVELNDVRTQENSHRRKENLKIIMKRNSMRQEEINKVESGEVGPIAQVDTPGNLSDSIMTIAPSMSRDIYNVGDIIRNDIKEILAFGQNQMGAELGRRKTASEAMIINQYAQLRSDERRDIIGDFLERTIKDINTLIFKFWDTDDVIKVTGPEGQEWATWNGEFLSGEYAISVVPNSTLPMTKELYKQQTTELVMKYRNDPYIDQKELHRIDLDAYEEFDTENLLMKDPNQPQVMMEDFRPGKGKRGSRIQTPENPEEANASRTAGEMAGADTGLQPPEEGSQS